MRFYDAFLHYALVAELGLGLGFFIGFGVMACFGLIGG